MSIQMMRSDYISSRRRAETRIGLSSGGRKEGGQCFR